METLANRLGHGSLKTGISDIVGFDIYVTLVLNAAGMYVSRRQ